MITGLVDIRSAVAWHRETCYFRHKHWNEQIRFPVKGLIIPYLMTLGTDHEPLRTNTFCAQMDIFCRAILRAIDFVPNMEVQFGNLLEKLISSREKTILRTLFLLHGRAVRYKTKAKKLGHSAHNYLPYSNLFWGRRSCTSVKNNF